MSHSHQPSGLRGGIEFLIDPGWSPEQAFAVVELIDDLRNRIWAHYAIALSEEYRNQSTRRKTVSIAANLLRHLAPPDSYGNSSPATIRFGRVRKPKNCLTNRDHFCMIT